MAIRYHNNNNNNNDLLSVHIQLHKVQNNFHEFHGLFPVKGLVSLYILVFHNTCYIILLMLKLLMMMMVSISGKSKESQFMNCSMLLESILTTKLE